MAFISAAYRPFLDALVFYGTSTIVGYLIPNPFYTNQEFYVILIKVQTIQFSISTDFRLLTVEFQNSSISNNSP